MATPQRAEGFGPELRASLFHFTVFGSTGAAAAYSAIWFSDKGLSAEEIGIINAVPVLLTLIANVLIGRLADRASDWRVTIIALALIAGVTSLGFLFAEGFWGLMLVFTLVTLPATALAPVLDAATLRMTARRGTDFSFIRAWGTVGYLITAAATGVLVGWFGGSAFVPIFVVLCLLRAGLAFPLPQFRAPAPVAAPVRREGDVKLSSLMRPWFLLPCLALALIQATHSFIGTMGALVWKLDGIPETWTGPLIAIGAAGEATMMFVWRRVGANIPARTLLIIAGLVGLVRWTVMALVPSLPVFVVLQVLHAITMPFSYFGIMHFVANWAPEEIAAEAQGFSSAVAQGVTVLTMIVFGWLIVPLGGGVYYVAAGMCLVAAAAAWLSMQLRPVHGRAEMLAA